MSESKETPQEVANRKQAKAVIDQMVRATVKWATEVYKLEVEVVNHYDSEAVLCFPDVNPASYSSKYQIVIKADSPRWMGVYRPLGTVSVKTTEPKPGGRAYSTKTVSRKALGKDGKLNLAPILKWLEGIARRKASLAEDKVRRDKELAAIEEERRASDAVQKQEIGGPVKGVGVFREGATPEGSFYSIRFTAESGYLTPGEVNAILDILRARKN